MLILQACSATNNGATVTPTLQPNWTAQRMVDKNVRPYFNLDPVPEDLDFESSTRLTGLLIKDPVLNEETSLVQQTYREGNAFVTISTSLVLPGQSSIRGKITQLPNGQIAWVTNSPATPQLFTVIIREQNLVARVSGSVGLERLLRLASTLTLQTLSVSNDSP